MITSLVLDTFFRIISALISALASVLPVATLPQGMTDAFTTVNNVLTTIDPIVPVSTLLICLGVIFGTELAMATFRLIMWILKKIPAIS